MPRRRKNIGGGDDSVPVMSQQDEADVVESIGAENDPDTGTMVADEDRVRAVGAVDAESVRENRRLQKIVDQKRGGMVKVPFNAGDLLVKYDTLIRFWPVNTLEIGVKRLTGTQTQWTIKSQPRSGNELYDAIALIHGRREETSYEVRFYDTAQKQIRASGHITLPDTQATAPQGQTMNPYSPQQPAAYAPQQQPQYAPQYPAPQQPQPAQYAPQYPAPQPTPAQQPVQQQPPVVHVMPSQQSPLDVNAMMAMQQQMFEMFRQMTQQTQPQVVMQAPPASMPAMPPPPQSTDPQAMMAWMQQAFSLFQQMQQQAAQAAMQPARAAVAAPPAELAQPAGMPPVQAPPGMMFVPGFGYVPVEKLFYALSDRPEPRPGGPYRGPRPLPYYGGPQDPRGEPYPPSGYPGGPHPGGPSQQQPPPQRPMSPAEQFRDAITIVKSAANAIEEFRSIMPDPSAPAEPEAPEDDSPVRVIDAGPAKIVINKADGSARLWETGFANMDKVMKWMGEQRESIQKANNEQQARRQQLPPGYVEVTPGYQPPPGYVAVPVDPQQIPQQAGGLPQPPQQMPPLIAAQPVTTRRTWEAPEVPR